jgi:hypothetical protein
MKAGWLNEMRRLRKSVEGIYKRLKCDKELGGIDFKSL